MRRWTSTLPRYRTAIILQREFDGPSSRVGNQRTGTSYVRVLKANVFSSRTFDLPTDPCPADDNVAAGTYNDGWTAWWPARPQSPTTTPYKIPDPPTIPRPVLPTARNPILWEAYGVVGGTFDAARISAIFAYVDWMPKTGREMMSGIRELSINEAAVKIRPGILRLADVNAAQWVITRVDDNSEWKLESIVPSRRRGEFAELMVERTVR